MSDKKGIKGTSIDKIKSNLTINHNKGSIEERLSGGVSHLRDSIKNSTALVDSYGNLLTSTGTEDKVDVFTKYTYSNDSLNYMLWTVLYSDSWVFKRAIDKPATDMVRGGIDIKGDFENKDLIYSQLKKSRNDLIDLVKWGRLYGGSIGVVMFDKMSDEDYSKPLASNISFFSSIKVTLYITDRWFGVSPSSDNVDNMTSQDFGKPKYYDITFADGRTIRVHHDYILRFENRSAPKIVKTGQLQGWGYAEGAHILNELSRDDQLKSSISSLINKSLIEVVKMSGMRGVFMGTDEENEEQLTKRLEMVNWARNFNSLTLLDKDDDYEMNNFSGITGLSDLLETNMWLVSAALEMQGVLFGDLKNGFSNDVDALERYDQVILDLNESYLRGVLEKYLSILYKWKNIKKPVEFDFKSLLAKKQDKDKIEALKDFRDLLSGMLSDGVLTAQQYAKSMKKYTENSTIDFGFTDDDIAKLNSNVEEEMEDIDLNEDEVIEEQPQKKSLFSKIFKRG